MFTVLLMLMTLFVDSGFINSSVDTSRSYVEWKAYGMLFDNTLAIKHVLLVMIYGEMIAYMFSGLFTQNCIE